MGTTTPISWTDSTFNPWIGCSKVSSGCDNCYAERLDHRFRAHDGHWGARQPRRVTSDDNWRVPLRWNDKAMRDGKRVRVFCASMADVFDRHAPIDQRERLWELIRCTKHLDWLLLTKRPQNIERFLPSDWGDGYANVWLGVSVENSTQGVPRIDVLRNIPAAKRFISAEPLLEDLGSLDLRGIDWLIVGGESGLGCRPMRKKWVINLLRQCRQYGVAFFFKQRGGTGKDKGGHLLDGEVIQEFPQ